MLYKKLNCKWEYSIMNTESEPLLIEGNSPQINRPVPPRGSGLTFRFETELREKGIAMYVRKSLWYIPVILFNLFSLQFIEYIFSCLPNRTLKRFENCQYELTIKRLSHNHRRRNPPGCPEMSGRPGRVAPMLLILYPESTRSLPGLSGRPEGLTFAFTTPMVTT